MHKNNIPIIEITANYIYLIILGNKKNIQLLVNNFNRTASSNISYHMLKMIIPLAQECETVLIPKIYNEKNKLVDCINIYDGAEVAQCYICAHGTEYHENLYMMAILESDKYFGFPKFDLDTEYDPEKIITNWFVSNSCTIPRGIKKNMEPVTVVGINNDILVVACQIY
jgi:hypothetical protein